MVSITMTEITRNSEILKTITFTLTTGMNRITRFKWIISFRTIVIFTRIHDRTFRVTEIIETIRIIPKKYDLLALIKLVEPLEVIWMSSHDLDFVLFIFLLE